MELKTMQDAIDEAARNNGYETFNDICYEVSIDKLNLIIKEAMKLYALQIAEAACNEQVVICADTVTSGSLAVRAGITTKILSAPQPDIEKLLE